jgi:hypothetical protein
MNFDYLPPQAPVMQMVRLDQPSPMQQYVALGGKKGESIADPKDYPCMRTCHMTGDAGMYNGLVGDVVKVSKKDNHDGSQTLLFDLRIPLENRMQWWPDMVSDTDHCDIPPSREAMSQAIQNSRIIRPEHNLYDKDSGRTPPYLMVKKLPYEKLQPIGSATHGMRGPGPAGVEMLPAMMNKPIYGQPAQNIPPGYVPSNMPVPEEDFLMGPQGPTMSWSQAMGKGGPMGTMPPGPFGSMKGGMPGPFGSMNMKGGMMPPGSMGPMGKGMGKGMGSMNPFMSGMF